MRPTNVQLYAAPSVHSMCDWHELKPRTCMRFLNSPHFPMQEMEFQASPLSAIEALIHINNQLRQPEAAVGVLTYAQVRQKALCCFLI